MTQPNTPDHLRAVPAPTIIPSSADHTEQHQQPDETLAATSQPPLPTVALYIDADNQSPQSAGILFETLADHLNTKIASITIAGNNLGKQIDQWTERLSLTDGPPNPRILHVPARKEAADIALVLALGGNLDRHIAARQLVVIVSRDFLLLEAAEQAAELGCRVMLAYSDSSIPSARNSQLSTLLMPEIPKPAGDGKQPPAHPQATPENSQTAVNPAKVNKKSPTEVLAALRKMCTKQPGSGYTASAVGKALSELGFDLKARRAFLKSAPNLGTRGSGSDKILTF